MDGLTASQRRRYESPSLRLSGRPLDLATAARECGAAVLGGGHGATAEVLLAGRPVVEVPAALEQRLGAEAVKRLGAGLEASAKDPASVVAALDAMLEDESYARAARSFGRRYAAFDPGRQRVAMLDRAEELLSGDAAGRAGRSAARELATLPV